MNNKKIISPCISICKSDPVTGFCYGCARTDEDKKIWKDPNTKDQWKLENLYMLKKRMSESQLKTFERSYEEKLKFGKLVYSKNLKQKPQN
tara:strand:- start:16308 stop:16580 length:273 start_codon:yes stop_codon:yes gene_type:complete